MILQSQKFILATFLYIMLSRQATIISSYVLRNQFRHSLKMSTKIDVQTLSTIQHNYLVNNAVVTKPPSRLQTLINLLELRGDTLLQPSDRKGLNPFLIPLSKLPSGDILGYLRWPTQKEDMDLQLVRTNDVGVTLESLGTDQYCRRIVAELDFGGNPSYSEANQILKDSGLQYDSSEYNTMLRSGKFPVLTEADRKLVLARYLLTKVGAFPDCYESIAEDFLKKGSDVSALVTCERAISVFYGWGHPYRYQVSMLSRLPGREIERRDIARSALFCPKWTIASNMQDLEELTKIAGFSSVQLLGEMHAFRSKDPRTKDVEEGLSVTQVTLDQAGHLMDAVALGNSFM